MKGAARLLGVISVATACGCGDTEPAHQNSSETSDANDAAVDSAPLGRATATNDGLLLVIEETRRARISARVWNVSPRTVVMYEPEITLLPVWEDGVLVLEWAPGTADLWSTPISRPTMYGHPLLLPEPAAVLDPGGTVATLSPKLGGLLGGGLSVRYHRPERDARLRGPAQASTWTEVNEVKVRVIAPTLAQSESETRAPPDGTPDPYFWSMTRIPLEELPQVEATLLLSRPIRVESFGDEEAKR